ncbi:peptidase [Staphylococcus delphini]|uniref:head maturation protease, ClpP-related n=1 Tax=Staphylococcus delphini TaxID=53344 RepID=UPI000BBC06CF|nr:head maturation protease, ClpP-related [Staphylococcus delphini]PCF33154.1 peptidase [Staphylococcus delphini]
MKINVKGAIVPNDDKWLYEIFGMDHTAPKDIIDALPETGEDIEVLINSGGGDVFSGSEIYTALKDYSGNVNVKVVGVAASAASIIAMAGDRIEMSPTAQMMIHNASTTVYGDNRNMGSAAKMLSSTDKGIANAYIKKTGKSEDEILNLMNDETWMNAQEAVELGFADAKMFEDAAPKMVASYGQMLSEDAKKRITALMSQPSEVKIDMDQIVNKVVEALNSKEKELKKPEVKKGFGKFFF